MESQKKNQLFYKYDVPVPRYTSYPTVPYWADSPKPQEWLDSLQASFSQKLPWSLYVHIPYCETLCTFCGCNTSITRNHQREEPYMEMVLKEWKTYLAKVPPIREAPLGQFHFGGGTPTFLSPQNLESLARQLMEGMNLSSPFRGSFEVDPRRTQREHLERLKGLGFSRLSLGVQDFHPRVQKLVHRVQPFEVTEKLTQEARALGYESINFDLIYGLPTQTEETVMDMMEKTWLLKPDRIALYSLALVPWMKPAQTLFKDEDLPKGKEKRRLYEIGRGFLMDKGYVEIGMDHFALPHDSLSVSHAQGKLHRNFMGYVEQRTEVLLGLGVSSISETPHCFHQNEKALPVYERRVMGGEIPSLRGHKLSPMDSLRREQILGFMTRGEVEFEDEAQKQKVSQFLGEMLSDGLVEVQGNSLKLTQRGKPFLRNACMALDERLLAKRPESEVFSRSM